MRYMILCPLKRSSDEARSTLRLQHLEYVKANHDKIVFGGPAVDADGTPALMLLIVEVNDSAQAESLIKAEPYYASGQVFDSVEIRRWLQVLPELQTEALTLEIETEKAKAIPKG